jgi:hypothetical protein
MHTGFSWGNLREEVHLKDPGVGGRIILKLDLLEVGWGGVNMDWMNLAKDRNRWQALVTVVMNLWVPYNVVNFLSS